MGHAKVTTTLSIYSHVMSKSIYENTAQTLDRAYINALAGNEKEDVPNDDTPRKFHQVEVPSENVT
jgi:hypothetical protein